MQRGCFFVSALLIGLPVAAGTTEVNELRQELEQMRRDYETRIQALEQRLIAAENEAKLAASKSEAAQREVQQVLAPVGGDAPGDQQRLLERGLESEAPGKLVGKQQIGQFGLPVHCLPDVILFVLDVIEIDIPNKTLNVRLTDEEMRNRIAGLPEFEPKVKTGYLARYTQMVSSADRGAVFQR